VIFASRRLTMNTGQTAEIAAAAIHQEGSLKLLSGERNIKYKNPTSRYAAIASVIIVAP
jgi:hypothetical protein